MQFQEALTSSTTTTTTHHQQHEILHFESSLTTTTTTRTDSESRVVFADPCSQCGTKKRRLCPLHQHLNFTPRKKLFTSHPHPLFQTSSVCQLTIPTPSSSTSPDSFLPRCSSSLQQNQFLAKPSPSSAEATPPSASRPPHPPPPKDRHTPTSSSGKGNNMVKSSKARKESSKKCDYSPEQSPQLASKEFLGSCSASPRKSPASTSKPKRHISSANNTTPTWSPIRSIGSISGDSSPTSGSASDSETRSFGSSPDKENWETMKEILGNMNKLLASGMFNTQQKEKPPKTNHHQKKGSDCDNILKGERGVYKGSAQCTCGKKYQLILSILPE